MPLSVRVRVLRAQLEKKLFSLYRECGDLEFPDEDWVFQVLPELNTLENDTLDSLLEQAVTRSKCALARLEAPAHLCARL